MLTNSQDFIVRILIFNYAVKASEAKLGIDIFVGHIPMSSKTAYYFSAIWENDHKFQSIHKGFTLDNYYHCCLRDGKGVLRCAGFDENGRHYTFATIVE